MTSVNKDSGSSHRIITFHILKEDSPVKIHFFTGLETLIKIKCEQQKDHFTLSHTWKKKYNLGNEVIELKKKKKKHFKDFTGGSGTFSLKVIFQRPQWQGPSDIIIMALVTL